jgi:hypothetical protein
MMSGALPITPSPPLTPRASTPAPSGADILRSSPLFLQDNEADADTDDADDADDDAPLVDLTEEGDKGAML